jgi:membrane-associated protease RseP (regulator of RpoE activity)
VKDPIAVDTEVSPKRAVVTAVMALIAVALLVTLRPSVLGTIAVVLAFFVMIMLHELGHFVVAKRAGMKVTEFFVGFGPRIWSVQKGETEYGLKAFPLGGYCKIIGMTNLEDVDGDDEPRTYRSKSYPARVAVAAAGSTMHFIIAFVLMFVVLAFGAIAQPSTTIDEVMKGQPAQEAGIKPGDRIQSIDGHTIRNWDDIPKYVEHKGGQVVDFVVERDGLFRTIPVRLATHSDTGEQRGFAGVGPKIVKVREGIGDAVAHTPGRVYQVAHDSVAALGKMFSPSGISNYVGNLSNDKKADPEQRFLSPVGFTRVANQAVNAGWIEVFALLIAINVFVGLFNLVPLLPFDGGHIAIATYERIATAVKGRRVQVDVAKLMPLTVAVVGVLGFIFLSSLFLDIANPIKNPF